MAFPQQRIDQIRACNKELYYLEQEKILLLADEVKIGKG